MPASKTEPVLIAGGGIGGLATALALARQGLAAHILERRTTFSEEGAGIQLGPNGTRILHDLGVAPLLKSRVAAPDGLRVLDAVTGAQLGRLPLGRWIAERHGAPYWVAHRRDLHAALLEKASTEPLITISTATAISDAASGPNGVRATAEDGRTFEGPALVAADGLWSKLREGVLQGRPPRPRGKSAARAVIPVDLVPDPLHRTEVHIWLAPGAHVVHYPVRSGHEIAIVAIFDDAEASTEWSAACDPKWIASRAAPYARLLRELLAAPEAWRKWSLHQLPEMPSFAKSRIAFLGDAAHPVLPFLAQGGVLALEDAVTLAAALASESNVEAALAQYAAARRSRAARVARASEMNGRIYHLSGPMAWARNFTMRMAAPERLMSGYDWLYGWKHSKAN